MSHDKAAETAIEFASQLRECVRNLCQLYRSRPRLIEREERAVREHDLSVIMSLRDDYEAANEHVEREVLRLRDLSQKIAELHLKILGDSEQSTIEVPGNVTECLSLLSELGERIAAKVGQSLANNILQHLVAAIRADWELFVQEKEKIEIMIQKNHTMLAVLVDNYQKSYQFWYDLVERCSSSYNAKGQQSSGSALSGFFARA